MTIIVSDKIESVTISRVQSIEKAGKMPGVRIHYYIQQEDYDPDFVTNYLACNMNITALLFNKLASHKYFTNYQYGGCLRNV